MFGDYGLITTLALGLILIFSLGLVISLRTNLRDTRSEIETLRAKSDEVAVARSEAARVPDLEENINKIRSEKEKSEQEKIRLTQEMEGLRNAHDSRLEDLRGIKKEIEDKFTSIASATLKNNSDTFLNLVSERFKQHSNASEEDLSRRQKAIENLVKPLGERLGNFDNKIGEIEKSRAEAYSAIHEQVKSLTVGQKNLNEETRKLVQALRAPKTRGRWGEMQLKQVFEMAGMTEHVDFLLEKQISSDTGPQRPDAIVRIPGGKSIVVDAKTPLEAYLDSLETNNPEDQEVHLSRHSRQVREHVRLLSSKAYQDSIQETPDFVVMFIPGETFVSAAAEIDPGLIEYAFENKVLISTPTTLMALIKAIAYGWQQEKMAENAAEVQKLARDLYDRLTVFTTHLAKVGKSLGQSVDSYNKAVGSMEGRVLPSARKFEELGVATSQAKLSALASVDSKTRRLTTSEFAEATSSEADPAE